MTMTLDQAIHFLSLRCKKGHPSGEFEAILAAMEQAKADLLLTKQALAATRVLLDERDARLARCEEAAKEAYQAAIRANIGIPATPPSDKI